MLYKLKHQQIFLGRAGEGVPALHEPLAAKLLHELLLQAVCAGRVLVEADELKALLMRDIVVRNLVKEFSLHIE